VSIFFVYSRLILVSLFVVVALLVAGLQPAWGQDAVPPPPKARIAFKETVHDFGTITQGTKVAYEFEYTNTGQAPLILSNVQTTCGCTASQWSRTPLPPGKTAKLLATYDSKGKIGRQNKVLSILSNAQNPEERVRLVVTVLLPELSAGDSALAPK